MAKKSKNSSAAYATFDTISKREIAELFEAYYELGVARNLLNLSEQTGYNFDLLVELCDGYAWDEKIKGRMAEMERMNAAIYQKHTADIRNGLIAKISHLLEDLSGPLGLPFSINSPADLRVVAAAYKELITADTMARKNNVDTSGGTTPKTWTDLLEQSSITSEEGSLGEH